MGQTYSQFKDYITTNLWRDNDTDLANNMDTLILQANDEIDKLTRNFQRRQRTVRIMPETDDFDLTTNVSDFQAMKSLTHNLADSYYSSGGKTFNSTSLSHIYQLRAQNPSGPVLPYYATDIDDGTKYLRLVGPFSAANPGDLTMVYRAGIPDYASDDASWVEDEYLNLYLYTVMKHCAIFLREDERVKTYAEYQTDAFNTADTDDKHNLQHGGSPMHMKPHRRVP